MSRRVIGWLALFWAGVGLGLLLGAATDPSRAEPACWQATTLGYVRGAGSAYTADGTSIWSREPFVAAHPRLPLGTLIAVEGFRAPYYVVRDRGMLSEEMLDFPVNSIEEAFNLTGQARACVVG